MSETNDGSNGRNDESNGQNDASNGQVKILLGSVFLIFLGQMSLNPIIAPLAREVGLAEWKIGFMISVAAVMVVIFSQVWGRRSQSWGAKRVLSLAMGIATASMAAFATLAGLGMEAMVTGTVLFILFVILRGVLFGAAISAIAPTAQAYIAGATHSDEARIKGMAGVGAVQGVAMIAGAVVGGALSGISIMVSISAVPLILLVGFLVVTFKLRREERAELISNPARISPLDTRVWPFLVAGFGMFTSIGFIQVLTGFFVQDRFALTSETTGVVTGAALLVVGLGMVLAQAIVVPRSGWTPATLLRIGSFLGVLGFLLLCLDLGMALFLCSLALIGFGLGIATPGYTAGASLLLTREEQGGLAGLVGATNGLTFVIAPTASTALYSVSPSLPIGVGATSILLVFLFVMLHPRFRGAKRR
ncbi:MFS transporter [Actinomycetaceae bacterium L2_0104]